MKTVLFVCTGNTCRSPMAAGIFNKLAKEGKLDWRAASCGLMASEGRPASENAALAMRALGVDLTGHKSRQVNGEMLRSCDKVFCVTGKHLELLSAKYPEMQDKMAALNTEVPDPYGGDLETYRKAAGSIEQAVGVLLQGLGDGI